MFAHQVGIDWFALLTREVLVDLSIVCPALFAGDHRENQIFSMHETGDSHAKDVRPHEHQSDGCQQAMQLAHYAFAAFSPLRRASLGFASVNTRRSRPHRSDRPVALLAISH
jgi:hypothetical protein